jgi:MoxR-like ATPase
MAWLEGRDYVSPDDVRNISFDVLRHRILLTFEAEAEGMTADAIIQRLIDRVPVTA